MTRNDHTHFYPKIIAFINEQDLFMISDVRSHLGVKDALESIPENRAISYVLFHMRKLGSIQCSDIIRANRQYIVIRKIKVEQFFERKSKIVKNGR